MTMTREDTAKTTAEDYVRQQKALALAGRLVTLPRVVQGECNSEEPHYLIYLTEEEIAHVLAVTAENPTGHMHPQDVLCAPPGTPPPPKYSHFCTSIVPNRCQRQ